MRTRTPALLLATLLTAACGGDGDPSVGPSASGSGSPAPTVTPSPTPSLAAKHGSAAVKGPGGALTLPEVGCEATHDKTGAVLGYYAVFGDFTGRPLNDPDAPHVEVRLEKGYRGDATYDADVEAVIGLPKGRHQGPAKRLVIGDGGRTGSLTFVAGDRETFTVEFSCDTNDPVDAAPVAAAPPPAEAPGTALFTDADGAVVRYEGLRCGPGAGGNRYLSAPAAGARTAVDALTVETDLTANASVTWRHFGVEHVYSRRELTVEVEDGEARFLRNGAVVARVAWACPA